MKNSTINHFNQMQFERLLLERLKQSLAPISERWIFNIRNLIKTMFNVSLNHVRCKVDQDHDGNHTTAQINRFIFYSFHKFYQF